MPLQADPTVIFAMKKSNDFNQVIKRVFYKDLIMPHPYNTYMNIGLPPGPIAMPDITALEAVLDPENDFIYFCASVERFGYLSLLLHTRTQCKCKKIFRLDQ
jgi:UPF0755 protein